FVADGDFHSPRGPGESVVAFALRSHGDAPHGTDFRRESAGSLPDHAERNPQYGISGVLAARISSLLAPALRPLFSAASIAHRTAIEASAFLGPSPVETFPVGQILVCVGLQSATGRAGLKSRAG